MVAGKPSGREERGEKPRVGRWESERARRVPDPDLEVIERVKPPFEALYRYCRVTVEGLENLPASGAIVAANHTGWLGLDYANLFMTVFEHDGRVLRVAVHPSWFRLPAVSALAKKLGLFEVSVTATTRILDQGGIVVYFPEAEEGNFKPISRYYRLEPFKPGCARAALASMKPIVPVVIVGGEEANPSLARIDVTRDLFGLSLPVPVNVFPFPVKWRIKFMPPVDPAKYLEKGSVDEDVALRLTKDLREMMQKELDAQVKARGSPWL